MYRFQFQKSDLATFLIYKVFWLSPAWWTSWCPSCPAILLINSTNKTDPTQKCICSWKAVKHPGPEAGNRPHTITPAPSCFPIRISLWFWGNLAIKINSAHFPTGYCSSLDHPGGSSFNLNSGVVSLPRRTASRSYERVTDKDLSSCQLSVLRHLSVPLKWCL